MRKTVWIGVGLLMLLCAGLVLAQTGPQTPFGPRIIFGSTAPDDFIVDPIGDRLIFVQAGAVSVVDATTFAPGILIDVEGQISASTISHDARTIALAVGREVQLYSLETGALLTSIEPPGTNYVTAPMMFSEDDSYLSFIANVPASQATRRSENDTDNLPWLWDINAALDLADSRLPGRVDAYAFFDLRQGGLYMLPNNALLGAIIGEYQVFDIEQSIITPDMTIESSRFENDPITLWFSAAGDLAYIRDSQSGFPTRLNTLTYATEVDNPTLNPLAGGSSQARIIGEVGSREVNPLLYAFFGYDYRAEYNYHPITVMLRDIIEPITPSAERNYAMFRIHDVQTGQFSSEMLAPANGELMAVDPSWTRLALRSISDGAVTVYDLHSGALLLRFTPAVPPVQSTDPIPFAFTGNGQALIVGYARYDAQTGAPLIEQRDVVTAFDSVYFRDDSRTIVTFSGLTWRVWDIETGAILRTETIEYGDGTLQAVSRNGERMLLSITEGARTGYSIYDIAANTRRSALFDVKDDMTLVDALPNREWTNFLVRFAPRGESQHGTNGALAIYSLQDGLITYMAGTDLPQGAGEYGWIDETTAFIVGDSAVRTAPDRVLDVTFDPSGVPACLIERYPDRQAEWEPVWRALSYNLPSDEVARLAQRTCAAADERAVAAIYTPTPRPTGQPQADTYRVRVPDVPQCLTGTFSEQAIAYARDWRAITEGLTEAQLEEMAEILCEGLTGEFAGGFTPTLGEVDRRVIYAIDAQTGRRTRLSSVPRRVSDEASVIAFLQQLYSEIYPQRNGLFDPILSPNQDYIAEASGGSISVIPITTPVAVLVQNATATAAATLGAQPNVIRVMPTATPQPEVIGLPGPTLTPTLIPTFLPQPETLVGLQPVEAAVELCPFASPVPYSERSETFQPVGRLIGRVGDSSVPAVLDFTTGQVTLDASIPPCQGGINCDLSRDERWALVEQGAVVVMRPDGAEPRELFSAPDVGAGVSSVEWIDANRLYIVLSLYVPDESQTPRTFYQYYDVRDGAFTEPEPVLERFISIEGLPTSITSLQPNGGTLAIAWVPVRLPGGTGARWYLLDAATGESRYFAGTTTSDGLQGRWQADGLWFDYRLSGDAAPGYRLDARTGEVARLERWVDGRLSRDGQSLLNGYFLPYEEFLVREEAGQSIPTLKLEDPATGAIRLYCVPQSWQNREVLSWSDDGRYLALLGIVPGDQAGNIRNYTTVYVLDTVTGEVVDMGVEMESFYTWIETAAGGGT